MSRPSQRPWTRLPLTNKNAAAPREGAADALPAGGVLGTPPRKRAVPLEDVHVRNIPDAGTPAKRARSRSGSTRAGPDAVQARLADSLRTNPHAHDALGEARAASQASPPPRARATTVRIDRVSRMSREERYHRERLKEQSQRQWKMAFGRAFPRFVFYLDHLDEAQKRVVSARIAQLGARVDEFFSRSVTHVVTTRPLPLPREEEQPRGKENTAGTSGSAARAARAIAPPRIVVPSPRRGEPLHSDRNPMDEAAPALPVNDVLIKAQQFGMKLWRFEKLEHILSLLLAGSGEAGDTDAAQDLSQMLHQEKLHGTLERDPSALRSDFYYFGKNTYHLLVTDATGEHRPVVIAEFDRTAHEASGRPPPWPVLHGGVEGRSLFAPVDARERERQARGTERPRCQTLRRIASLNGASLQRAANEQAQGGAPASSAAPGTPALMASDNSLALASTVASTTSTAPTTALNSQAGATAGGLQDKRVAELNRRVHTPVDLRGVGVRGATVRRMLDGERAAGALRRTASAGALGARPPVPKPAREKRPGHCENCRCRFEDFDEHVQSRRHRKFALDESNFVQLDELIQRVQREPVEMEWPEAEAGAEAGFEEGAEPEEALDAAALDADAWPEVEYVETVGQPDEPGVLGGACSGGKRAGSELAGGEPTGNEAAAPETTNWGKALTPETPGTPAEPGAPGRGELAEAAVSTAPVPNTP